MNKKLLLLFLSSSFSVFAQVTVTIDFAQSTTPISPLIYGRNNSLSSTSSSPTTTNDWNLLKEAGIRFTRENSGNNCSKYNWRLKMSSHPDWYNNVYAADWDYEITSAQTQMPSLKLMYGFQLLGMVAKTNTKNFGDYAYNSSQSWLGVHQNLAGGGVINTGGGSAALTQGDTNQYLKSWPVDSSVAILNHWLNNLNINPAAVEYWNLDNEPDIWNGTHDDVMRANVDAEFYVQKYIAAAKKARALYPNIKLTGPVAANEWQWYAWNDANINYNGKNYSWLEYFIKRVAEEQISSGIRLLDVIDLHHYPSGTNQSNIMQYHRVYFDPTYVFPEANGVKKVNGGWDASITTEKVFVRCNDWLNLYLGAGHGVNFGVSETDINSSDANTNAMWYASLLGEFMRNKDAEYLTPWTWKTGMWETVHLFSRYNHDNYLPSVSNDELNVSAHTSINDANDSATVLLINRSTSSSKSVTLNLNNLNLSDRTFESYQLKQLPSTETFVSHTSNALTKSNVNLVSGSVSITLPAMSVTSIIIPTGFTTGVNTLKTSNIEVFPNPANNQLFVQSAENMNSVVIIYNLLGENMGEWNCIGKSSIDISNLASGTYTVKVYQNDDCKNFKVVKIQ